LTSLIVLATKIGRHAGRRDMISIVKSDYTSFKNAVRTHIDSGKKSFDELKMTEFMKFAKILQQDAFMIEN
jgi:hypothetical protein